MAAAPSKTNCGRPAKLGAGHPAQSPGHGPGADRQRHGERIKCIERFRCRACRRRMSVRARAGIQQMPAKRGHDKTTPNPPGRLMPKNSRTCDPMSSEASNRKKLLIATRPASALRSLFVRDRDRLRKSGMLPTGNGKQGRITKQERIRKSIHRKIRSWSHA